jgi:hypothetical protein
VGLLDYQQVLRIQFMGGVVEALEMEELVALADTLS